MVRVAYLYVRRKDFSVKRLIKTDAPDEVIEDVCKDIESDGIFSVKNAAEGIVNVLKARGYKCTDFTSIPEFVCNIEIQ